MYQKKLLAKTWRKYALFPLLLMFIKLVLLITFFWCVFLKPNSIKNRNFKYGMSYTSLWSSLLWSFRWATACPQKRPSANSHQYNNTSPKEYTKQVNVFSEVKNAPWSIIPVQSKIEGQSLPYSIYHTNKMLWRVVTQIWRRSVLNSLPPAFWGFLKLRKNKFFLYLHPWQTLKPKAHWMV